MDLPLDLDYPILAIGDLHGQITFLDNLLLRLRQLAEWPACRLVFLGDLVDRGENVKATLDRVLELLAEKPGSTAVMGNHDLALVRAAQLDGRPNSSFWVPRYWTHYDHQATFSSYLGKEFPRARDMDGWKDDLRQLREAMPASHRELLTSLQWLTESEGHVFLHNGLSPELDATAGEQVRAMRNKRWDRSLRPLPGSTTDRLWQTDYPVWIGADKSLSDRPKPLKGKLLVSGHVQVPWPEVNSVRIRIDTSGGIAEPLTACLLTGPRAEPRFIFSNEG